MVMNPLHPHLDPHLHLPQSPHRVLNQGQHLNLPLALALPLALDPLLDPLLNMEALAAKVPDPPHQRRNPLLLMEVPDHHPNLQ